MQFQHVGIELFSVFFHALGGVVAKQRFLQTMETGELRIGGFLLIIVFTGVNAAVEIREQLSDRLDALIMLTRWRIQGFRFFDIARFHRVGKGFGSGHQVGGLFRDVRFIRSDRCAEAQQCFAFCRISRRFAFHDQLAFRVSQQAAGHVVFARLQVRGHFLTKTGRDVFTLFHNHHAFEDFPLQRLLAVVLNNKLRFTAVDRDSHRLTLFIVHGHFHLRNISRLSRKRIRKQRCHTNL
ncbi:hypothetical protein D3C80_1344860 [compost metagenome]